jgi:hypothetical protein
MGKVGEKEEKPDFNQFVFVFTADVSTHTWNTVELPQQHKTVLLHLHIRKVTKLTIVTSEPSLLYLLPSIHSSGMNTIQE